MSEPQAAGEARQRTLLHAIGCVGVGLHSGARTALTLHPAPVGHGIRFRRVDRPGTAAIAARYDHVVDTALCTTLGLPGGPRVATVEHILAAFAACEIDNALVDVSGPEVPAMDGSAQPFVFLIECAGTVEQEAERPTIEVLKRVSASSDTGWAALEPADGLVLDCRIEFDNPLVGTQERVHRFRPEAFRSEIAPARTFGFAEAVEELRSRGMALGGSLKNAVVFARSRVLNDGGLRFADEPVRHKLLDAMGDLALAGARLRARYVGRRSGHALSSRLLHALFADPSAWRLAAGALLEQPDCMAGRQLAIGASA
jgi:UDP-3-O-[3-hydroxymyristoyl] N-acetylglucosamine deacetylase